MGWREGDFMESYYRGGFDLEAGEDIYFLLNGDTFEQNLGIDLFKENEDEYLFDRIYYNLNIKEKDEDSSTSTNSG